MIDIRKLNDDVMTRACALDLIPHRYFFRGATGTSNSGSYTLSVIWDGGFIDHFFKDYGINAESMTGNALVNEVVQHVNSSILEGLFSLGWKNNKLIYDCTNQTCNLNFTSTSIPDPVAFKTYPVNAINSNTPIPYNDYQLNIRESINNAYKFILSATGENAAERTGYAVTNIQIATALSDDSSFTSNNLTEKDNHNGHLYYLGKLRLDEQDEVDIYVDPHMSYSDTRVLIGIRILHSEDGAFLDIDNFISKVFFDVDGKFGIEGCCQFRTEGYSPQCPYYTFHVALDCPII